MSNSSPAPRLIEYDRKMDCFVLYDDDEREITPMNGDWISTHSLRTDIVTPVLKLRKYELGIVGISTSALWFRVVLIP